MVRRLIRPRYPLAVAAGVLAALALASTAFAQEEDPDPIAALATDLNNVWLMVTAFMVFFMQAGFAMVEAGFTRTKNTTNILMKNMLDACVGGLLFFATGYAIAYGVDGDGEAGGFMGNGQWFLTDDFQAWPFWIFQFAFAATAATIVSGAMAERTKFGAYLVYTAFISGLIYPFVVHWAWDVNGWMTAFTDDPFMGNGYIDFAGSGVVHMVGGAAGLVGAIVVGPRLGRFSKDGSTPIPGHNISMAMLGVLILWFGWYGFNPGSTLLVSDGISVLAGKVAVNTTLATAGAAVTAVIVTKLRYGKYDAGLMLNGVLAGLVAITAGCATVEPWAAIVIGAVGFGVMMLVVDLLEILKIDDPVGAGPVHLGAGLWGVIAVGLLSSEDGVLNAYGGEAGYGLLLGGGAEQLGAQLVGAGAILGWTAVLSAVLFVGIKLTMGLRVSEEEELTGLDLGEHGMQAYPEFSGGSTITTSLPGTGGGGFGGNRPPEPGPAGTGGSGGS